MYSRGRVLCNLFDGSASDPVPRRTEADEINWGDSVVDDVFSLVFLTESIAPLDSNAVVSNRPAVVSANAEPVPGPRVDPGRLAIHDEERDLGRPFGPRRTSLHDVVVRLTGARG